LNRMLPPVRVGVGAVASTTSDNVLTVASNVAVDAILFAGVAGLLGAEPGRWGAIGAIFGGVTSLFAVTASSAATGQPL